MSNGIKKTTTQNTMTKNKKYFILDNSLFEVEAGNKDNSQVITKKEFLSEFLNKDELKNKLLPSPFLKQVQMYQKDGFKCIKTEQNNGLTLTFESDFSIAKLSCSYEQISEKLIEQAQKRQKSKESYKIILTREDINKLNIAVDFASTDELRDALTCINIKNGKINSTNGRILYYDNFNNQIKNEINLQSKDLQKALKKISKKDNEAILEICGSYATLGKVEIDIIRSKFPSTDFLINAEENEFIQFNKQIFPKIMNLNPLSNKFYIDNYGFYSQDQTTESKTEYKADIKSSCDFLLTFDFNCFSKVLKHDNSDLINLKLSDYGGAAKINDNFIIMPTVEKKGKELVDKLFVTPKFNYLQFCLYYLIYTFEQEQKEVLTINQVMIDLDKIARSTKSGRAENCPCFDNWNKAGDYEYFIPKGVFDYAGQSYIWVICNGNKIKGRSMKRGNDRIVFENTTAKKWTKLDFALPNNELTKNSAMKIIRFVYDCTMRGLQEQKEVATPNYLPVLYTPTTKPKKEFKSKKVQPELHNSKSVDSEIIQSKYTRCKTFKSAYNLKLFLENIDNKDKSSYNATNELGLDFFVPVWVKAENGETVYFSYDKDNFTYNYSYIDQQRVSLLLPAPKVQTVEISQVQNQENILDDFQQRVIELTHAKKRTRKQSSKFAGTFEQVGIFASVACLVFLFLNTFVMINNYNPNFAELSKPKETNTARARPKQHSNFPIYLAMFGSLAVVKPRKNGTVDYLTQDQIATVANMLEQRGNGKRHKLIWLVGANTGLRISDILTLTMNDLYQGKLTMQKTQKQVELVVLEGLLKVCREFAEENNIAENELLFGEKRRRSNQTKIHRQVDVMSNQAIYKVWVDVGNQIGINIGCHTPRKSFGRILYERTKDISIVAKFLGHTDIASTMHYIGLTKNLMQDTRLDIGLIGL
jgi:integrase